MSEARFQQESTTGQFYYGGKLCLQVIYEPLTSSGYSLTVQHFKDGALVQQDVFAVPEGVSTQSTARI